jgi:hypothetical protein
MNIVIIFVKKCYFVIILTSNVYTKNCAQLFFRFFGLNINYLEFCVLNVHTLAIKIERLINYYKIILQIFMIWWILWKFEFYNILNYKKKKNLMYFWYFIIGNGTFRRGVLNVQSCSLFMAGLHISLLRHLQKRFVRLK